MPAKKITPIRKQYLEIKRDHPDAILFFRLGDFYETFDQDAEIASRELDIVLTSRIVAKGQRIPMAGIPFHAADNYISRLINKGYHVAICEQVGKQPKKGLFPRKVVRVVTPGTVIEPGLVISEKNNYLVSIFPSGEKYGLAFMDLSTGEFGVTQLEAGNAKDQLLSELSRLNPSEILIPETFEIIWDNIYFTTRLPEWKFESGRCEQSLKQQFEVATADGFGLKHKIPAKIASGLIIQYIRENEPSSLSLFIDLNYYSVDEYMLLDDSTRRNLELTETLRSDAEEGSLIRVIDKTITPMGKRLIRKWLNQPLINPKHIQSRLDIVEIFKDKGLIRAEIQIILKRISDIERIINRILSLHATPRDLVSLRDSLSVLPEILRIFSGILKMPSYPSINIQSCPDEYHLLNKAIVDDPPATLQNIGVIREGFSEQLDGLMSDTRKSRDWIANLETNEKKRTGIKTLKVGYNKVYGYYIEISKGNSGKAPDEYIRKQTLVNAERFITPELKEYESIVLNAEERIREMESQIFGQLCGVLGKSSETILSVSRSIAALDVLLSFSQVASENDYSKPMISADKNLVIKEGRHPVVEKTQFNVAFVPNDTVFKDNEFIHIITGPNMSGKSTYLRQTALIVLMAQIGSFVPASTAQIGLVDRIFTRIGAQDEIHAGQSTFMVEMIETANILHNATERSLLILDEIGRGTSTYDGLSIAWAVLEFIHNHPRLKARSLFATHYHELTHLPETLTNIKNYNVAVTEEGKEVIFLHKITEGRSNRSYGIHVARLAGIPSPVIQRAAELLIQLEHNPNNPDTTDIKESAQMALFSPGHPIIDELREMDVNSINPIEALNKLFEWKKYTQSD